MTKTHNPEGSCLQRKRCVELQERLARIDVEYVSYCSLFSLRVNSRRQTNQNKTKQNLTSVKQNEIRALLLGTTTSPEKPVNSFPNTNNLFIQSDQLRITLDTVIRAQIFELRQHFPQYP